MFDKVSSDGNAEPSANGVAEDDASRFRIGSHFTSILRISTRRQALQCSNARKCVAWAWAASCPKPGQVREEAAS